MRQSLKLATINPATGSIYALLFNDKLIEVCLKPSTEFLLRNYGKSARVLKIPPMAAGGGILAAGEHPITIDTHRGYVLISTCNRLLGWNVASGSFGRGVVNAESVITKTNFALNHGENFDPRHV